jgi:hypothetical protein
MIFLYKELGSNQPTNMCDNLTDEEWWRQERIKEAEMWEREELGEERWRQKKEAEAETEKWERDAREIQESYWVTERKEQDLVDDRICEYKMGMYYPN